jgi:hypothetical protein
MTNLSHLVNLLAYHVLVAEVLPLDSVDDLTGYCCGMEKTLLLVTLLLPSMGKVRSADNDKSNEMFTSSMCFDP